MEERGHFRLSLYHSCRQTAVLRAQRCDTFTILSNPLARTKDASLGWDRARRALPIPHCDTERPPPSRWRRRAGERISASIIREGVVPPRHKSAGSLSSLRCGGYHSETAGRTLPTTGKSGLTMRPTTRARRRFIEALRMRTTCARGSPREKAESSASAENARTTMEKYTSAIRSLLSRQGSPSALGKTQDARRAGGFSETVKLDGTMVRRRLRKPMEQQLAEEEREERERLQRLAREVRGKRIRAIYEDVLFKAGKGSARKLFESYFGKEGRSLVRLEDVEKEAERREEAKRLGDSENRSCTVLDCRKKRASRSVPRGGLSTITTTTPRARHVRAKLYGRWYLKPKDFSARLREYYNTERGENGGRAGAII